MHPHIPPSDAQAYDIETARSFEFSDLLYTIWKGKWFILLITLLSTLFGAYYVYEKITPIYSSSAVVVLKQKVGNIARYQSLAGSLTGDSPETNAEIEILLSRSLMRLVVHELNLIEDPEFNRTLTAPSQKTVLKSKIKQQLGWGSTPQKLDTSLEDKRIEDAVVTALLTRVEVVNLRQSPVFRVTAHSKDAIKAAKIADAVVNLYIQSQIAQKIEASEHISSWLSNRVGQLQLELEQAEMAVSQFSTNTTLISPENLNALERQLKDLRERIVKTQRLQKASLSTSPKGQTDFDEFEKKLSSLKGSKSKLAAEIDKQAQDLVTLQQLTREAHATRALYEHFLSRLKETAAQTDIQEADSRVLSPAVIPDRASTPRKPLLITMAAILGFTLSVLILFIKEFHRTTFRSLRALERLSQSITVSELPVLPVRNKFDFLEIQQRNPKNDFAMAIRNLRATLLFGGGYGLPHVIAVTSAIFDEDTAPTAIALAQDLAGLNKKILLIDTDSAQPDFENYFGDEPSRGIVSVLKGLYPLEQSIHHPDILDADVLFANEHNLAASDAFMSQDFRILIEELKERYDVIILNAPAVLMAPSARAVLSCSQAVLFNIKSNATTKTQVRHALRLLAHAKIPVSGFLLTQMDPKIVPKQSQIKKASEKLNFSNA